MIYWPKLGDTLEGIANKGPEYIYESQITTTLVEEINELGRRICNRIQKVKKIYNTAL